jgi:hypothetical protein
MVLIGAGVIGLELVSWLIENDADDMLTIILGICVESTWS